METDLRLTMFLMAVKTVRNLRGASTMCVRRHHDVHEVQYGE
jgi:hypothetical protein